MILLFNTVPNTKKTYKFCNSLKEKRNYNEIFNDITVHELIGI